MSPSQWQLNNTTLCFQADPLHSSHMPLNECLALHSAFWIATEFITALPFNCYLAGATWNCCQLCSCSVETTEPCTSLQCHFIQSHICRVRVYLAATCHLHFGQNEWDLLRATTVTHHWNRKQCKRQHRKLTQRRTFQESHLCLFNHEAGALPLSYPCYPAES